MTREGCKKHKELIEAWANGALIEYLDSHVWHDVDFPTWRVNTEYRIKQQEPKKKTIVLETWLCKFGSGSYYTVEGTDCFYEKEFKVKLLSTREVEIDED